MEPLRNTRLRNLTLFHTRIHDLTPLQNLPLEILDLRRSSIADISPLRGMALRELYLWQSRVQDLSTLTTLQLEVLDASETPLATLAGINFSKMRLLRLGHTAISDISPLAGSPVDTLHFDAVNVTNVEALLECKKLRWAIIPRATRNVDLLKTHPSLQRLSYGWNNESQPSHSVKEFWEIFDSKK